MNVLVGQAFISDFYNAFPVGNKPHKDIRGLYLREFVPRVIDYCLIHNYQYDLLTMPEMTFPPWFNKLQQAQSQKLWFLSQYNRYDYFLWLDVDVLVHPNSPAFPFSKGFTAVLDCAPSRAAILSKYRYVQVPFDRYCNSGVWGIDSLSAKNLWENGVNKLLDGRYREYEGDDMLDQSLLNQLVCENVVPHNLVKYEWNTLICGPLWNNRHQSNFVHYAGGQGDKHIRVKSDLKRQAGDKVYD